LPDDRAAILARVLMLVNEHAEMAPKIDQCGSLVGEPEFDALHIASFLAANRQRNP